MSIYTDDTVKALYYLADGVDITSHVIADSFEVEDYLVTDQLNFGECNSSRMQLKTDEDLGLTGQKITVRYGTADESVTVGQWKVTYSSTKVNSTVTTITAYDASKEFDIDVSDWYNGLTWPQTIKTMRDSLCSYVGVSQVSTTLVNDDIQILETISPSSLNGKDMLVYLGQLNGCFPHATSSYTLDWVVLSSDIQSVPSSILLDPLACEAKDYDTAVIGGVTIEAEDGDVGGAVGSGTNHYVIAANVLCYGMTTNQMKTVASGVYSVIAGCQYYPTEISIKYNPEFPLGSYLTYNNKAFYNLGQKLSGCLDCTIEADGTEYLEDYTFETVIEQLKGKTNVIQHSVEENSAAITDVENNLSSKITQTATSLEAQIDELQNEITGTVNLYYVDEEPTLLNYPAWDFTYNIPCDNTVQISDDLHWIYNDDYYQRNLRSIAYYTDEGLTYRFMYDSSSGLFYWKVESDSEFGIAMQKISDLQVTADGLTSDVTAIETLLTQQGEQIETNTSNITQTASEISTEVSRAKGSENALSSRIKQTATGISLTVDNSSGTTSGITIGVTKEDGSTTSTSGTIELTGLVKFTDLSTSGSTTINGANITTGSISCDRLSGGTISGQKIKGCTISSGCSITDYINATTIILESSDVRTKLESNGLTILDEDVGYGAGIFSSGLWGYTVSGTSARSNGYTVDLYSGKVSKLYGLKTDTAVITVSDKRLKHDIDTLDEKYLDVLDALEPVSYRLNIDAEDALNLGFVAQDVKNAISGAGIGEDAIVREDQNGYYSLEYNAFIPILVKGYQSLKAQNEALAEEIQELKNAIAELKEE